MTIVQSRMVIVAWIFAGLALCRANAAWAQLPGTPGWYELPNTKISTVCPDPADYPTIQGAEYCQAVVSNWNSAAFDTARSRLIVWGGGHNGYYGNELYSVDLLSLTTTRITDPGLPSAPMSPCIEAIAGGTQPNARHTYDGLAYIEHVDRMFVVSGTLACDPTDVSTEIWTFDFATNSWHRMSPSGDNLLLGWNRTDIEGTASAYDPISKFVFVDTKIGIFTYNFLSNTLKVRNDQQGGYRPFAVTSIVDPVRRYLYSIGGGQMWRWDISTITETNQTGSTSDPVLISSSGAPQIIAAGHPGLAWDSLSQRIVAWAGGDTVYWFDGTTNVWTSETFTGGPAADNQGTFKRFSYVPAFNVFVSVNSIHENAFVLRLTQNAADALAPDAPKSLIIH